MAGLLPAAVTPAVTRGAAPVPLAPPEGLMAAVGAYVERYYASAQRVMAHEAVTLQPLHPDLSANGFPRRLEYDLRIEWTPGEDGQPGSADVHRTLLTVNGRKPRPGDEPGCLDPKGISPEPLAMLLPARQPELLFTGGRPARVAGRTVRTVDYRAAKKGEPVITWREDCVSIELPGWGRGRVWADPESGEVLRIDERLAGQLDIPVPTKQQLRGGSTHMTLEQAESSIRYKPVRFTDPDETALMPAEVESLTVYRDAGTPRLRTRQVFSGYRRFLAEGRILLD